MSMDKRRQRPGAHGRCCAPGVPAEGLGARGGMMGQSSTRRPCRTRDGTAKECGDSVIAACAKKSDAALSLAQSELQSIKFTGSSRADLDLLLSDIRNKARAVRVMGGRVDKEQKNILIHSLPADPRWRGLQGALFAAADIDDVFALIKTVAINTKMPENTTVTVDPAALNTSAPKRRCTNPGVPRKKNPPSIIEEVEDEDLLLPRAPCATPLLKPVLNTAIPAANLVPNPVPVAVEYMECTVAPSTSTNAFVSRTFENHSPKTTITFLDSALASEGDFAIVGKGTVTKVYKLDVKVVHLTFRNTLHAHSLSANLVSVSQFDKAGYYSTFGGGGVTIREGEAGEALISGRGSAGMNPETIKDMQTKNLVDGLDITNHKLSSMENVLVAERAVSILEHTRAIQNQTCRLSISSHSISGDHHASHHHMMALVDSGISHKHTAYLKDKSDDSTIPAFDEYRSMAERQMGKAIKRVRTDNAFNSNQWKAYFRTPPPGLGAWASRNEEVRCKREAAAQAQQRSSGATLGGGSLHHLRHFVTSLSIAKVRPHPSTWLECTLRNLAAKCGISSAAPLRTLCHNSGSNETRTVDTFQAWHIPLYARYMGSSPTHLPRIYCAVAILRTRVNDFAMSLPRPEGTSGKSGPPQESNMFAEKNLLIILYSLQCKKKISLTSRSSGFQVARRGVQRPVHECNCCVVQQRAAGREKLLENDRARRVLLGGIKILNLTGGIQVQGRIYHTTNPAWWYGLSAPLANGMDSSVLRLEDHNADVLQVLTTASAPSVLYCFPRGNVGEEMRQPVLS
ncbi:hypothetical protein DFH08DRAFT_818671 [Mycena albidolilacea]|uniref:Uncharacterized protein n=1 Tax=Mycena albidolilacea TaxID=1033008 RepID=A0AAD6ZGC6_9AGAR|nr:hypothetical protein DFH08DRAFT_818671 [Mycena albidolilacea]